MSVKIRLKRFGTKKRPYYRIIVIDSRAPRDGRQLEEVGLYHPIEKEGNQIRVNEESIKSWLKKGARPSPTVKKILNKKDININKNIRQADSYLVGAKKGKKIINTGAATITVMFHPNYQRWVVVLGKEQR